MPTHTSSPDTAQYDAGLYAFRQRDYEGAAALWLSAATTASGQDARKIADGLSAVAAGYLRADKTDDATERLYMRALELRQAFLAENDESIGIEFNNLGMLYERREDIDRAIEYLERAANILDTHPDLNKENFADPYDNLASIYLERKNPVRALELCQRALEIRDNTLGRINPFSMKSLELLAEIQDAIKPHSRAARETRKEFSARLVMLAAAYEQLGDPLLKQALLVSSECGAREALDIISTSLTILCQDFLRNRRALSSDS